MLAKAYKHGSAKALEKLGLGPPTQVDQFMADVESGKDVPPSPPPMANGPMSNQALDGTTQMQMPSGLGSVSPPTPQDTIGSTVGHVPPPPPSMAALHG